MDEAFSFFKLERNSRLAAAAGCFASGVLLQVHFPWGSLPGFALIVAPVCGLVAPGLLPVALLFLMLHYL